MILNVDIIMRSDLSDFAFLHAACSYEHVMFWGTCMTHIKCFYITKYYLEPPKPMCEFKSHSPTTHSLTQYMHQARINLDGIEELIIYIYV